MTTLERLQRLQDELAAIAGQMTQEEKDAGHQSSVFDLEDSLYELVVSMGGADEEEVRLPQEPVSATTEPEVAPEVDEPVGESDPAIDAEIIAAFQQAYEMMDAASDKMLTNGWSRDSLGWASYLELDELMNDFLVELQA